MDRISVLMPDADAWATLLVAHCLAANKQVDLHGLSGRPSSAFRRSRFFSTFECMTEFTLDSWLDRIAQIVSKRKIDIVLPVSDFAIRSLAEHNLDFGARIVQLPSPCA